MGTHNNRLSLLLFILQSACTCLCTAQHQPVGPDTGFVIKGTVYGLDSGKVFLQWSPEAGNHQSLHAPVRNGKFELRGSLPETMLCFLGIVGKANAALVFVENREMEVSFRKDSMQSIQVKGSPSQDLFSEFWTSEKSLTSLYHAYDSIYFKALTKHDLELQSRADSLRDVLAPLHYRFLSQFVTAHPSSSVSAYLLESALRTYKDYDELDKIFRTLAPGAVQSIYGKGYAKKIFILRYLAPGKTAPDFSLNNSKGEPVPLSSFKGKIVLVDFWASWCSPCRGESPYLVKAYKKFHRKGFEIVSVSLDDKKPRWENAIKKDKLNWTQLCDFLAWKGPVAQQYVVEGIPTNELLDKNGIILARDLRGKQLLAKLDEVFKE